MILCQHEEPANITSKLKEVEHRMANQEKSQEQAKKLTMKLEATCIDDEDNDDKASSSDRSLTREERRRKRHREKKEAREIVRCLVDEMVDGAVARGEGEEKKTSRSSRSVVEIDCTSPEIRVTPRRRVFATAAAPSADSSPGFVTETNTSSSTPIVTVTTVEQTPQTPPARPPFPGKEEPGGPSGSGMSSYSPRPRPRLKRHNAKRDSKRIPLR